MICHPKNLPKLQLLDCFATGTPVKTEHVHLKPAGPIQQPHSTSVMHGFELVASRVPNSRGLDSAREDIASAHALHVSKLAGLPTRGKTSLSLNCKLRLERDLRVKLRIDQASGKQCLDQCIAAS